MTRNGMMRVFPLAAATTLLIVACAPQAPASRPADQPRESPRTTKTLRIGTIDEPSDGIALFSSGGGSLREQTAIFHAGLTLYDARGQLQPHSAEKVPTLEAGDWKTFADGQMEVTWKLRPDVRWHDGAPLTAEDFVFGLRVLQDPELPLSRGPGAKLMSGATAPDAHTLVVRWKQPYPLANDSGPKDIPPVPRHLMADLYEQGDKTAFMNHNYWAREFVGLGPYRLGEWVLGSHLEAAAFDAYFLGRPNIDRLVIRYITDLQTLFANLIAGEVDLLLPGKIEPDVGKAIKAHWDPTGGGTVIPIQTRLRAMELQYRDPTAPWVPDPRVRQALLHLTDRQALVDALLAGMTAPADFPFPPGDPIYPLLEARGVAKRPYDVMQGERLLAEAGWRKGTDGLLRSQTGQTFDFRATVVGKADLPEALIISDQWKAAGLNAPPHFIPDEATDSSQQRAQTPGGVVRSGRLDISWFDKFWSAEVASERNRWRGRNALGHSDPAYDELYARFNATLELDRRQALVVDLLKFVWDRQAYLPLYHGVDILPFRKGLQGPAAFAAKGVAAWNLPSWTID